MDDGASERILALLADTRGDVNTRRELRSLLLAPSPSTLLDALAPRLTHPNLEVRVPPTRHYTHLCTDRVLRLCSHRPDRGVASPGPLLLKPLSGGSEGPAERSCRRWRRRIS